MAILRTFAVAGLTIAVAGAAFGGEIASVASANAVNDASGAAAAEHATLNVDLPAVAANVVAALVGGENPSTAVANRGGGTEKASQENDETNETEATEAETNEVSAGQQVGQTGSAGTKPGWGCGDKNHTHSGPPGRPANAPTPPGCAKSH